MDPKVKLMIVDDHQLFRDGLKAIFAKVDNIVVVCEANNGKEAIEMMDDYDVNVCITDLSMPVMNGVELTKYIVQNRPEISVLALSMHNDIENIDLMLNAGAKGYMLKNASRTDLIVGVRALSEGKEYFSDEVREEMLKTYIKAKTETFNIKQERGKLSFTKRELDIISLIRKGYNNTEVAEKLKLSIHTVGTHKMNIYSKMGVTNYVSFMEFVSKNSSEIN